MTLLYILLAYVANVFLARWIALKFDEDMRPPMVLWFWPLTPIIFGIVYMALFNGDGNDTPGFWRWFKTGRWLLVVALLAAGCMMKENDIYTVSRVEVSSVKEYRYCVEVEIFGPNLNLYTNTNYNVGDTVLISPIHRCK